MSCVFLSCDELSSVVKWCGAMGWDLMSLWCDVAGCDVTLIGSKSLCGVNWKMICWSVLHRSTPYYKVLLQYYSVLHSTTPVRQSTTPVLFSTTKYYSSTTPYYKVLLQYYSVLHSTTLYYKVLFQYYSLLQFYYKVLLQYYSVLQSTTPVLLRTTIHSTTPVRQSTTPVLVLKNKVLLQYYSVLHSTTPVLLCTSPVLQSTTPVLFCTTPALLRTTQYYSSTTPYYKVLLQYYSVLQSTLQSTTPVLLRTTQYYSSTTPHNKVLLQYYSVYSGTTPCTTKYSFARRGAPTSPTSPNAVPATQNDSHDWSSSHMKRETSFTMRRATELILQRHQMLRLPRKMTLMIDVRHTWHVIYNARSNRSHPPTSNAAPATQNDSHHLSSWHMKRYLQCAEQQESSSNFTKYCACHAKWISWLIRITYEKSFTMREATRVILQLHQILRLPRKMNLMIDRAHIWKVIYNAWSNKSHPPTSANTAPATQNESHDWSASHMKRHLQCAEQQESSSNFTKYCACHAKWISWLIRITYETAFTMRGATRVILQLHQILRLPRKMNLMIDPHHIWNVIYNARSK